MNIVIPMPENSEELVSRCDPEIKITDERREIDKDQSETENQKSEQNEGKVQKN